MNKKKRITIRNPHLINLRNSLRKIIIQAVTERNKVLLDKSRQIWKGKEITKDIMEQLRKIDKQVNELSMSLRTSICRCVTCARCDTDMIFNPRWKAWYCPNCYENSIKYKPPPHESDFDDD